MKRLVVYLFLVVCLLNISLVYAESTNSLAPTTALMRKKLFVNTSHAPRKIKVFNMFKALLFEAVSLGSSKLINSALGNGADVNAVDHTNRTVLHSAAEIGDEKLVEFFLAKMRKKAICKANNLGHTALHLAASRGHKNIVRLLLQEMPPKAIMARNHWGQTVLHLAVDNEQEDVVQLLLPYMDRDAINEVDLMYNSTALDYAVQNRNVRIAKLISEYRTPEEIAAVDQAIEEILVNFKKHGLILEIPEHLGLKLHVIFSNPVLDIKKISKQISFAS